MRSRSKARTFIPVSVILEKMHEEAPAGHVTLEWLMRNLQKQSFGLIILLLAIFAAAPGICVVAGFLLMIPAFQMIIGRPAPAFPRWIATRALPTRHLGVVVQRAVPVLRFLEKTIRPRFATPPDATKCVIGITVMMLSVRLLITPIPLSNVLPAVVMALISLAYLEEDGLVLSIGLMAGFVILAVDLGVVWEIVHGAKPIGRFW